MAIQTSARVWAVLALAACATPVEVDPLQTAKPVLAETFGCMLTADASIAEGWLGPDPESVLAIERIEGRPDFTGTWIEWSYGGWWAERGAESCWDGTLLEPGCRYRVRGYEVAVFRGLVNLVEGSRHITWDDAPSDSRGASFCQFRNVFRVVEAQLLESGAQAEPDASLKLK